MGVGHSRPAKLFLVVAGVVGAVHLAWALQWVSVVFGVTTDSGAPTPVSFQEHARRSVPKLLAAVPEDAAVMVVTSVIEPVPFDFYLLPRSTRLLAVIEPLRLAALEAKRLDPSNAELAKQVELVEERYRRLRAKDQLWSVSVAKTALDSVDFVLAFAVVDSALLALQPRLRELGRDGHAVLFQVEARK